MSVSHFRELKVWQVAMSLVSLVYRVTASFPSEERFGLTAQLRRAAVSIPSNIAEGNARQATRDYARFVSIASGSNAEFQTQLIVAKELDLVENVFIDECMDLSERVGQMLYRLHQSLSSRSGAGSRVPGSESR